MGEIAATLVAWLAIYTYPVAALTVLVGALGVPLPTAVVVLAAGSISRDGDPDPFILFAVILAAAVAGDVTSYSLARWGSTVVEQRAGSRIGLTQERLLAVEHRFERWGGLLVLVTRCVVTGLALPTNIVAGASTYPLARFFCYAVLGEAIWAGGFITLGWLYGPSWIGLLDYLDDAATALTAMAVAGVLVYVLVRLLRAKPA